MKFLTFLCLLAFGVSYSQALTRSKILKELPGKWKISYHKKGDMAMYLSTCEEGSITEFGKIYSEEEGVVFFKSDNSCDINTTAYYKVKSRDNYYIVFYRLDPKTGAYNNSDNDRIDIMSLEEDQLVLGSDHDFYVYHKID